MNATHIAHPSLLPTAAGAPASPSPMFLVADIGGTNARFAWAKAHAKHPASEQPASEHAPFLVLQLQHQHQLSTAHYPNLAHAIKAYWQLVPPPHLTTAPPAAVIAIAAPILGDRVQMTNASWDFSIEATRLQSGLKSLRLLNDFEAVGLAIAHLTPADVLAIGAGAPQTFTLQSPSHQTQAVLGAGTGLGMTLVVPPTTSPTYETQAKTQWQIIACEGGHASPAPTTPRQMRLLQALWETTPTLPYLCWENILSGAGLARLHQAVCQIDKWNYIPMPPTELAQAALVHGDPASLATLHAFCAFLGSAAGNLALTAGARGGIYLTGGVLHRLMTIAPDFLNASAFRQHFEMRGAFQSYMQSIPTWFIKDPHIALRGCATLSAL